MRAKEEGCWEMPMNLTSVMQVLPPATSPVSKMKLTLGGGRSRHWLAQVAGLGLIAISGFSETIKAGPAIQFADATMNFGTAMAGDLVVHDFVFTNTGDAPLEITGVYPTCNCTTVDDWTRAVAPGQRGHITLEFDSTRMKGAVAKTVIIISNDRAHYNSVLSFQGVVKKPVEVSPPIVILKPVIDGGAGEPGIANIKNNLAELMTLGKPVCDNPAFAAELKTVIPEREFQLTVRLVMPIQSPMLQGAVTMRTSSTRIPSVTVPVIILPQEPLTLLPPEILLPAGPLSMATNVMVTLSNHGRKLLALADARMDVPNAGVQIKETLPGREFIFSLTFPAGFRVPRDREAALTITTTNSQVPAIKVPLRVATQIITGARTTGTQFSPLLASPAEPKP